MTSPSQESTNSADLARFCTNLMCQLSLVLLNLSVLQEYSIPLYNQDSLQDAAADLNVSPQLQGKNEYVCNTREKSCILSPQ